MKLTTKQVEQARVQARAEAKQKVVELIPQQISMRCLTLQNPVWLVGGIFHRVSFHPRN